MTAHTHGGRDVLPAPPGFATLLRWLRCRAQLSQNGLAQRAGFDHAAISRLESGDRNASPATVRTLALALELSDGERVALLAASVGLSRDDLRAGYLCWPDDRKD